MTGRKDEGLIVGTINNRVISIKDSLKMVEGMVEVHFGGRMVRSILAISWKAIRLAMDNCTEKNKF